MNRIVFQQVEGGWDIEKHNQHYLKVRFDGDEAYMEYPDGHIQYEHPEDLMAQVTAYVGIDEFQN